MTVRSEKNITYKSAALISALMLFGVIVLSMTYQFATYEETRERIVWQNRISVVLNGRAEAVSQWIESQKQTVKLLAENTTLRLYVSNNKNDLGLDDTGAAVLEDFILPLLNDRAAQNGFSGMINEANRNIKANVERKLVSGLALTNTEGDIVLATNNMPATLNAVKAYLGTGLNEETIMVGPYEGATGLPSISIVSPVYKIDDDTKNQASGFIVGVRVLDEAFFDLLLQPGEMSQTAANFLVRKKGNFIHYLSALRKSDSMYQPPIGINTQSLAAQFAIENPGEVAQLINYLGDDVLVSGAKINGADWVMVRSIGVEEALGRAKSRKINIIIISSLLILCLGIIFILIWRHGVSVRLQKAIRKQKEVTEKYEKLNGFMSVVTNSQPTAISAVDENGIYTYANLQAARLADATIEDMIGKTLTAVLGGARARTDEINCQEVLLEDKIITKINVESDNENSLTFKTDYVPLELGEDNPAQSKGVLIVKEDISALEQSRKKREIGLKSLVSTLTMIIASRDPFSATHSERVVTVIKVLCDELAVDEVMSATCELAGAMMYLGKITVPKELLVKPTNLSDDELDVVRASILKSADMIKDIEFEGPVCETIEQTQAHWDGSGIPEGLSGEDIMLSARIASVANAFVGMTSARAYRSGMDMKEAINLLLEKADIIYDRRPVIALMNYVENKGGMDIWAYFNEAPLGIKTVKK